MPFGNLRSYGGILKGRVKLGGTDFREIARQAYGKLALEHDCPYAFLGVRTSPKGR